MLQRPGGTTPHAHAVNFYDHDAEAVSAIAQHVEDGLAVGERVVVVATAAHRAAMDDELLAHGTDPVRARASGRLLVLDAAEMLSTFVVDGSPDPDLFRANLGAVIDAARADGSTVRAFGEMVALLWQDGNVAGALEVESLWNDLALRRQFSLLCAYPTGELVGARLGDLGRVCELHSEVFAPTSYRAPSSMPTALNGGPHTEVFVPVPEAVAAVRRFVMRVLEHWGEYDLLFDAELVTSEMATNAVMHANSPFRARVERSGAVIRIAIEDSGVGGAERRAAAHDDLNGRGVEIIDALASQWGCDELLEGKVVWAEFAAGVSAP